MLNNSVKIAVAEAIGTFALIFVGVLAITAVRIAGAPATAADLASIGLAHGLTIAVMVAALGAVSGGHFNPAVTFGFVVTGRMNPALGLLYWAAQLAGASGAGLLLAALFGPGLVSAGTPDLAGNLGLGAGVALEAITTFFLVLVVFGTAVDERGPKAVTPLAIGLTVALDIMAIGPLTGAAMNPARTFGPALASGHWANHLVYWIGPLLGGGLAALVHQLVLAERPSLAAEARGAPAGLLQEVEVAGQ
jgi:MIP family channel proteins